MKSTILLSLILIPLSALGDSLVLNNEVYKVKSVEPVQEASAEEFIQLLGAFEHTSYQPVVFRGIGKAMNGIDWTPELLGEILCDSKDVKSIKDLNDCTESSGRLMLDVNQTGVYGTVSMDHLPYSEEIQYTTDNLSSEYMAIPLGESSVNRATLFASTAGALSWMHDHPREDAYLIEFTGKKRLVLAAPDQCQHIGQGLCNSDYQSLNDLAETYTVLNHIDPYSEPDTSRVKFASFQEVILEAGDMLYIPCGWYHSVEYIEDSAGISQFAYPSYIKK